MGWNLNFSIGKLPNYVERDSSGNFFYSFLDNIFGNKNKLVDTTKYTIENPALLIVRKFIADYGSLAKIHAYKNNKLFAEDYIYEIAERPNPNQTWTELIWQYYFYACAENVYLYSQNGVIYLLKKENISLTTEQLNKYKKMYFSSYNKKSALKGDFKYKNENGSVSDLKLENLYIIDCLSGLNGDWFNGECLIDSIKGIVDNSTESIESKGRNIFYTKKILVSGNQTDAQRLTNGVMSPKEQESVTSSLLSSKPIHSVKDNLNINQLVDNLKQLGLDESFNADFGKVLAMFGIHGNLIGLVQKNSVFSDDIEKSLGLFVFYRLIPMLQKLTDVLELIYEQEDLRPSFSHCPFNKVFEKDKQNEIALKLDNLLKAQSLGLDVKQQLKELFNGY